MKNIKNDSAYSNNTKNLSQQIVIHPNNSKNCDDCNSSLCDCALLSNLIWPLTILLIVGLFYKSIKKLLSRIINETNRVKVGSVEFELKELDQLTNIVENRLEVSNADIETLKYNVDKRELKDFPIEIIKISMDIEKTLRELYSDDNPNKNAPLNVPVLIENLRERGIFNIETTKLIREFWMFRNGIIHSTQFSLTEKDMVRILEIGIRIQKILLAVKKDDIN